MAAAMFWISVSQLPAAIAVGVQDVLNEYQRTAPWLLWQFSASAGGSCPAEAKTRRMPRVPRGVRSSRKPAQVLPLPTVSDAEVVAPTARVGRAAWATVEPDATRSAAQAAVTSKRCLMHRG